MFEKILVPLDGSKLAKRALPHALHIAKIFGSKIQLLQVLDSSPYQNTPTIHEPLNWQIHKAQAELSLAETAAQLRNQGFVVEHFLREGKPAESILNFAQQEGNDLVIISTHGATGLSRWNMSSVAYKVISRICLPVLIIRTYVPSSQAGILLETAEEAAESGSTPGISGVMEAHNVIQVEADQTEPTPGQPAFYRKILIPIDTSRRAECVIPAVVALTEQGAQSILVAVIQPPSLPIPPQYQEEFQQFSDRFLQMSRSAVQMYLEEQKRRIPGIETRMVEDANVAAAIHALAEQDDVDLVVLAAHGQTGGTQWPYGSVVKNYIDHGVKNVLVVQDIPCSQFRPTAAEIAAEKYGRR